VGETGIGSVRDAAGDLRGALLTAGRSRRRAWSSTQRAADSGEPGKKPAKPSGLFDRGSRHSRTQGSVGPNRGSRGPDRGTGPF
jgi:hypothetical protein